MEILPPLVTVAECSPKLTPGLASMGQTATTVALLVFEVRVVMKKENCQNHRRAE